MRLILAILVLLWPLGLWAHDAPIVRYAVLDGEPLLEAEGEGVDETSVFAIASVGKTFTSVAVLRLVERGVLALDERVIELVDPDMLPELDGLESVTLRHLLTMTSGLVDYYDDVYLEAALNDPDTWQRPEAALSFAEGEPQLFAAGTAFDYSNTNYVLLGMVLEAVTGRSFAQVLDAEVFRPAGMTDSFVFGSAPLPDRFVTGHAGGRHVRDYYAGQGFGDGGAVSSARDLVRFYTALFQEGRLLPPAMLREMQRDPVGEGYGMGIMLDGDMVGHTGGDLGFSSDVVMDRGTGDIAVVLVGEEDGDTDWAYDLLADR